MMCGHRAGYCFPYILSVCKKTDKVEVHNMVTSAHVQSIPLPTNAACDIIDCRTGREDTAKGRNHVRAPTRVGGVAPCSACW